MSGDDHLGTAELIAGARDAGAERTADRGLASANADGFPVFGEQQRRQFDASPHAMRIAEHGSLRYLAVNNAALELYGYTRAEFLKLSLRDTRHPEELAEQTATFSAHTGCLRHSGVRRHVRKSGEIVFVEVITQDILFDGRPARLSLTVDVTGRLRMQELLWQRQEEFESLANNLPDVIARFNRDRRYAFINAAVEAISGMPRQHFIGKTMREADLPEELARAYDESLAEVFATGKAHNFEVTSDTPRGRRLFDVRHVPEMGPDGEVATVLCVTRDITERKQGEDELWRQQKLLDAVFDNLPVGVFIKDAKTFRYIMRNSFNKRVFGSLIADHVGKSVYDLFPKEQADGFSETDRTVVETRRMVEILQQEVMGIAGDKRIQHVRKVPLFDETGQPWVIVGISDDITERKHTEQALRETNEFLRGVIESSRDCVKVLDLEGRLLLMNAGGQGLMEIDDLAPLLNSSWLEFWRGDDRVAARAAVEMARNGGMGSFEGYCPARKGTPRWWDVVVSPILDADGRPVKLLAVSRDITRRRKVNDELRESEERFRLLAENIHQIFWINTRAGDHIDYVSPAYEEIWGRSRESLYRNPRSWMESIHPDDLPAVRAGQEAISRGERTDVDYRIIRPDGTLRWIKDRSYPMQRADGTQLVCGLAEDISAQKLAEQERLTNAVQQRDALVREVHHRIKNSLQGVAGLLRQKIRKYPAIAPGIEEAIAQLQSVALVYGLQETRPDGLIALAEIMDEVCASTEGLTGGHVDRALERKTARPACIAGSEAVSVAVALNELVFNALKHQAGAGRKRARVTLLESNDAAEIRIANRGQLPKGFDYPGGRLVGQGLRLVRTLLASPGGSVAFNGRRNEVEVVLKLRPPLLAGRQKAIVR